MNEPSKLKFALQLTGTRLQSLDMSGQVKLRYSDGEKHYPAFTGYIVEGHAEQTQYTLRCQDPSRILQETKIGGAFGRGVLPGEIIYYLLSETTPESTDKTQIASGQGSRTIAESEWLFQKRRFMFIAPCPPCKLPQGSVDFGDATLYMVDGEGNIDDQIITHGLPSDMPTEWGEGKTRVMFYVQAEGFLNAFEKGRARLQKLMDYLSFGAHFSTPGYHLQNQFLYHNYARERTLLDFSYPRWAYVRDIVPSQEARYWLRWYAPHRLADQFEIMSDDPLIQMYPLFSELLEEDEEQLSSTHRAILNAIHALRNARQAENTLDGVDFIWQCVEFLSAGYSIPENFSEKDRKLLKRVAKHLIKKWHSNATQAENQARFGRLDKSVDELNRANLREKWNMFCNEHNITYTEADTKFLWMTRNVRNNTLHGRPAAITRKNVERTAILLEKAIIAAIANLTTE